MRGALSSAGEVIHGAYDATGRPDLTVRGGLSQRKVFTRTDRDQQVGFSLVWARRWW